MTDVKEDVFTYCKPSNTEGANSLGTS